MVATTVIMKEVGVEVNFEGWVAEDRCGKDINQG